MSCGSLSSSSSSSSSCRASIYRETQLRRATDQYYSLSAGRNHHENLCRTTSVSLSLGVQFLHQQHFNALQRLQSRRHTILRASVLPNGPPPHESPSSSSSGSCRKGFIVGTLMTILLSFFKSKWGPLHKLIDEVETVVETTEHVVETVEYVAEEVEKVAEAVADSLPEGGKLKEVATLVEHVAEEIAKDAHIADAAIDKVEDLEKKVEDIIEEATHIPKELDGRSA